MAADTRRARQSWWPGVEVPEVTSCNQENFSLAQRERLQDIIASDIELGVVAGIKEHLRQLLPSR